MEVAYSAMDFVNKLKKKEISSYSEIPEEFHDDTDIIAITRELDLRKVLKRGYDIISNTFFVEEVIMVTNYMQELVEKNVYNTFQDFNSYYNFLNGDIYNNACYFQYDFSTEIINRFKIEVERLNMKSVLEDTIDDCLPEKSEDEKEQYRIVESQTSLRKRWIKKYNDCTTYKQLSSVNKKHEDSKDSTDVSFYLWNYINYHGKKSYKVIMQFICSGQYPVRQLENALCFLYGAEHVLKAYNYKGGAASTNKRYNLRFKDVVQGIINTGVTPKIVKYFDKFTHYYCVRTDMFLNDNSSKYPITSLYKYFDTFKKFVDYLEGDLSDCDFSDAMTLNVDFSKYKTNSETKLPISVLLNLKKIVSKRFDRIKNRFEVIVKWYNVEDVEVFSRKITFKYFFDFVAFLKNDLSGADLLYCDGLKNLSNFSELKLNDAKLRSFINEKVGLHYVKNQFLENKLEQFKSLVNNEKETAIVFNNDRQELCEYEDETGEQKIYYITDLHLMHRIYHSKAISDEDCTYVIQLIIDKLLEGIEYRSIILIGGDIASCFWVFQLFVKLLRKTIDERNYYCKVFFTLGNHELWEFYDNNLDYIVSKYRTFLSENNMYLIQNDILYLDDKKNILRISQQEINELTYENIRERLRMARVILFGGMGFSGYNQDFNANNGIYRNTLSREDERIETSTFESLYEKVCDCLSDRNVIIITHMPFTDWHNNPSYHKNFVYVNGHNHRNYFYDDGITRIYSDNQVGYTGEHPILKYLYIDNTYDWFSEYEDGIYLISREDYVNFYRGKNLTITFNRDINKLYMLKKHDYYCFIHQNKSGGLTILNGGGLKSLKIKDLEYYYNNMDVEISYIKNPLDKFLGIQSQIAKAVKDIGGWGYIHGAIIDIDYHNHIYINPHDLTITPYFAWDMVEKYVYPSVPSLLKAQCPTLFSNYDKALCGENANSLAVLKRDTELIVKPKLYLSTDIYVASRILNKMQKLNSNILTVWFDNIPGIKQLPLKVEDCLSKEKNMEKTGVKQNTGSKTTLSLNRTTNTIRNSYVGKTKIMNCGMKATVIEDFGCKDLTVQFEDGLIRKHRRRDHFDLGKIAHVSDNKE